jgi:Tfp pilus assembly PilM family ATPase
LAVDWGYSNTTLSIVGDDRPLFTRRIQECAFGHVLDAIVEAFAVTRDEAQHLAEAEGLAMPNAERAAETEIARAISAAAAGTIDELIRQLSRTLQFMEMQRRHLQPSAVWLLGGGASLKNFGPYLSESLSLPVHVVELLPDDQPIACAAGARSAIFANAAALSALAWRAA